MKITNPFIEIYRSKPYSFPYNYSLADFPFIIDIESTNMCNLDCIMCPRQILKRPKGCMELKLLKRIIDEVAAEGGKGVRFIGYGEPLLNPNIFEMIEYAHSKQLLIHLTTNGILLDNDKVEEIFNCKLDSIIFSLQGTTKEEYTKMRNNPFYDKLVENIKKLVDERNKRNLDKPHIQVTTTTLDETEEEIKSFCDKWSKIVDKVDNWYTSLKDISHIERIKPLLKRQKQGNYVGSGRCKEVLTKLTVFWDGDISACCGDFNGQLKLGNISSDTLKEIWHSEKLNNLRKIFEKGETPEFTLCKNCNDKFLEKENE